MPRLEVALEKDPKAKRDEEWNLGRRVPGRGMAPIGRGLGRYGIIDQSWANDEIFHLRVLRLCQSKIVIGLLAKVNQ